MNPLIDQPLAEHWANEKIEPLPLCDDATFLRRVTLDLAGRIPSREEMAAFQKSPNRAEKIDELLATGAFSEHMADLWTATLNGYSNAFDSDREALRLWLVDQFQAKKKYNEIVTSLISATGNSTQNGAVNFLVRYPDEAGVRVSRLFLGVRLDCARCHDHPFDRWTEDDFANFSKFFGSMERQRAGQSAVKISHRLNNSAAPTFLTGAKPQTRMWRDELALFIEHTNAFAKNFANRIWYQLVGRGIVQAPDDFNAENPPSVPALLDSLANFGKEAGWDFQKMIREICNSDAYQRSSLTNEKPDSQRAQTFAVRPLKPLTPEQWFASVEQILDRKLPLTRREFLQQNFGNQVDEDFAETWNYRETVQHLMRRLVLDTSVPAKNLEDAYALILNREMTPEDRKICNGHAVPNVAFALMNSSEFFFNH
ncbi:MAG: DUF1549 domain-containing protein [Verrucomicrobiales bacterium]|nr:DUF1549 domain-containing protein [Verrucomicrobiales bacterium]